jgi:hypothetical protein
MFKNFSDGAVAATVDKPPTTPAVYLFIEILNAKISSAYLIKTKYYQAARTSKGPPNKHMGAIIAPKSPA